MIFYCKMIVEDIVRFLLKESALPNYYFVLQTARSTLLQKEKKPPIKLNNVRYQTCSCLQLPSNKYKKISCQDTQFTDTLKIINPHSPIAYGHITMAYPTFFFWCVHTHRISIQSLTTDLNSQKHTYCIKPHSLLIKPDFFAGNSVANILTRRTPFLKCKRQIYFKKELQLGAHRETTVVAWKWTLHVRYTRSLFVVLNMNLVKKLRLRFVQNCVVSEDEKEKNAWTVFTLHG